MTDAMSSELPRVLTALFFTAIKASDECVWFEVIKRLQDFRLLLLSHCQHPLTTPLNFIMNQTTLTIGDEEIIYNGVRYVPDPATPFAIKVYLMRSNHTFIRVYGKTPATVLAKIRKISDKERSLHGGTVFIMNRYDRELSRVNFGVQDYDKLNELLSTKLNRTLLKNNAEPYVTKPRKKVTA